MLITSCISLESQIISDRDTSLISGVDVAGMDTNVRPQDDYYAYANGRWLATTEIPSDQIGWGSYLTLRRNVLGQLREIIDSIEEQGSADDISVRVRDFYNAYLDKDRVEALGIEPLLVNLSEIDALESHGQVAAYFGQNNAIRIDGPMYAYISQDDKDSEKYAVSITQSGLGLPDRDYYFDESQRGIELRDRYISFIALMLDFSGYSDPDGAATRIMALETRLAEQQWDKVDNRDVEKTYNKVTDRELGILLSNFNPDGYFSGLGSGRRDYVIVRQPSYIALMNAMFLQIDLATWKEYLRFQVIQAFSSFLPNAFVDASFEFYDKTISGRQELRPRWERAIGAINYNIGELLGPLYVAKHFPPEAKKRTLDLVDSLIEAYSDSIKSLDWMSDETKRKALLKLSKFTPKIGYPDKWKDYSALDVAPDDLVGNVKRARIFNHRREIDKLDRPVDRTEWFMAPQTVNAYYSRSMNEIVFPAAFLQPPNFHFEADDAYNYGAIGSTIGHEVGHGFDDQGSKYDGEGNLNSWWTDEDRARFEQKTVSLVEQFNKFEALPGLYVNGEYTLGENIGDLGGTAIAFKAYKKSLDGATSTVIDGFSGEERFFLGFAQSSRITWRDQFIELQVKTGRHSPDVFRVNGVVANIDEFYQTYNVKKSDGHFLPAEQRVRIWR